MGGLIKQGSLYTTFYYMYNCDNFTTVRLYERLYLYPPVIQAEFIYIVSENSPIFPELELYFNFPCLSEP